LLSAVAAGVTELVETGFAEVGVPDVVLETKDVDVIVVEVEELVVTTGSGSVRLI
jgi:hypothetical protein